VTFAEKKGYIERMMGLVEKAEDFRTAESHYNYVRGIMSAWYFDMSLSQKAWEEYSNQLEGLMVEKRKLN
jgi:hypothetical protein